MKLKLFLDEDIHTGLSHALRQRGFDVVHAQDLKRKGKSDSEQLAFAVQEERCFMTFNIRDFVNLHNQYVGENREHWGIIVSKQMPIGETFRRLLKKLAWQPGRISRTELIFCEQSDFILLKNKRPFLIRKGSGRVTGLRWTSLIYRRIRRGNLTWGCFF